MLNCFHVQRDTVLSFNQVWKGILGIRNSARLGKKAKFLDSIRDLTANWEAGSGI